ncbi:ABC transporter ATP-binding protein [Oceaniglobus ichthyenteri]|uniref:ABC transporter ATP-binding protein n=1 Tax=Oceaniglobus ichthyenteri TaxID=2136177 RepID=UPI000D398A62|nr:ABC transporter ATP-binding protein [Oceaniglobus ichthyenteri]
MTQNPVLEFDRLVIAQTSGGKSILNDISLSVAKGEVLALIGESGSGKTSLALSALGRIRPGLMVRHGNVRLAGLDMIRATEQELRHRRGKSISYIAQSAAMSFNQRMRLDRQVTEPAAVHGAMPAMAAIKRAHALYASLGLPDPGQIGARFPHEVSGGQLQRFMIAMGLLLDPDLVVCDEPTSALDVTTQIEVLRALKTGIRENGTAALFVSHDLAVVAQVADRIAVLKRGDLIECASTTEILENPQHDYTRELIRACQRWPVTARDLVAKKPPAAAEGAIEARGIVAGYGSVTNNKPKIEILKGVSLNVARGRVVAIIGESGSGKSTLARVIAGLHAPAAGTITLSGKTLADRGSGRTRDEMRRIQMVFQSADTALNAKHSVGRILGRVLDFFGDKSPGRIAELLEMVNLPAEYARRKPSQLSGGEKQRVNLARALAARPEVLICDEITSALDTVVAASIIRLVEDLRDRLDLAILFISHDMATVAALADQVVVLKQGVVVENGAAPDVLLRPQADYTRLLLGSVPELRIGWLEDTAPGAPAL